MSILIKGMEMPSDCEILQIKCKLAESDADAVLVAVEARLI